MEEKKLTDEEIIKDIERSTGMPSYWKAIVLDLIHRLQSEIKLYQRDKEVKDTIIEGQNKMFAEQKEEIERLSGPIGKFKDQSALLKAYESLEKEFTKRSQRLKELQKNNDDLVEDLANMTIYPEEAVKRIMAQTEKCTAKEILILAEDYNYGYESNMDDFMKALKERYCVEVE